MPSTAFGPLVEPGWPSTLPGPPDLGQKFLNAFAIGSEINRRKQQLENQLAGMAIREHQNEMMNQFREAEYRRKLDQGDQRIYLAEQGRNLQQQIFDWKVNKDQETIQDVSDLASGITSLNLDPADPKRPSAIWDIISKNPRAAKIAPGLIKDAFGSYNNAIRTKESQLKQERSDLMQDVKNSVGRGQTADLDLLYNPDEWQTEYVDKQGVKHAPPPPGADYAKDWKPTGMKYVVRKSVQLGQPDIYIKLPAQKLTDLSKRLRDLDSKTRQLPQQVTNEYVNAQQSGSSLSAQDQRMLDWARAHPGDPRAAQIKSRLNISE